MNAAKFLFWLGIAVMVVGVLGNGYTAIRALGDGAIGYNAGAFVVSIFSPLWQGGLLVGLAKILEKLHASTNERVQVEDGSPSR